MMFLSGVYRGSKGGEHEGVWIAFRTLALVDLVLGFTSFMCGTGVIMQIRLVSRSTLASL